MTTRGAGIVNATARAFARGGTLVALRSTQAAASMLIVVAMSRSMTEAALSTALFLLSITGISGSVGVLGFDVVLVKMLGRAAPDTPETRGHYADLAGRFLLVWALVATLFGAVFLFVPAAALRGATGIAPGWLLLWFFLAAVQSFQSSVLLGFHRQRSALVFVGTLANLVALAIILWETRLPAPLRIEAVAFAWLAGLAASVLLAQVVIHRHMGWVLPRPGAATRLEVRWRALFGSSLINVLALTTSQLPFWVINLMGSDAQIVSFGLAFRLVMPIAVILTAARAAVSPMIAREWHARALQVAAPKLRRITSLTFTTTLAISAGLIGLHDRLFETVFHRPDAGTFWPLAWLLAGQCLLALFGQSLLTLRITDRQRLALGIALGVAALQAGLAPVAFLLWGATGVAVSVALSHLVTGAVGTLLLHRRLGLVLMATPRPFRPAAEA